jgi:hypothetical protein
LKPRSLKINQSSAPVCKRSTLDTFQIAAAAPALSTQTLPEGRGGNLGDESTGGVVAVEAEPVATNAEEEAAFCLDCGRRAGILSALVLSNRRSPETSSRRNVEAE